MFAILCHEILWCGDVEVWLEAVNVQKDRVALFRQSKEPQRRPGGGIRRFINIDLLKDCK